MKKKRFLKKYQNNIYYSYDALCVAINQTLDNGINILYAEYYSDITMNELENIFRSTENSSELLMLNERLNILHENGSILIKEYNEHFIHWFEQSGGSAVDLVELIVKNFPSYRNKTVYHGQRVSFSKRAQILVSDIWGCLNDHGLEHFIDMIRFILFK